MVELDPGAGTPTNRHPGHELILPLSGVVSVESGGLSMPLDAAEGLYAHYHSRFDHAVVNAGGGPAKFLVIRFHE